MPDAELKKQLLHRGSSLCAPDPYAQLLSSLQEHDLDGFKTKLEQGTKREFLDPNHWYDDPHYGTLLDIACKTSRNSQFVHELLKHGADPSIINHVRSNAPIHLAAQSGDIETLKALLKDKRTNVNALDSTGSSALHIVCNGNKFELLHILLNHSDIRVNLTNKKGKTAIYLAAVGKHKDIVLTLLKFKGIDIDKAKTGRGKTARDEILENLPELTNYIPERSNTVEDIPETNQLFYYLYADDEKSFISSLDNLQNESKNVEDIVNSNDGKDTLLQYICEYGFVESVKLLLDLGANPNLTGPSNIKTPIMIACYRGYYDIVKSLSEHDKIKYEQVNQETVLHSVIQGTNLSHEYLVTKRKEHIDHYKCFKYLLNNVAKHKININQQDNKGSTVLHYAAKNGNPELILMLLRHGMYIGTRNKFDDPALKDIPASILESYLNECLHTNNLRKEDPKYEIIFKYNFLRPPTDANTMDDCNEPMSLESTNLQIESNSQQTVLDHNISILETDPLLYMSRSKELKHLLCHPVLTSFIHLKWFSIRRFFYINLTFYLAFWSLLSTYILAFYSDRNFNPSARNITDISADEFNKDKPMKSEMLLWILLVFCLVIFVTRELFQMIVSPFKYFKSLENWLEISLIFITGLVLFSSVGRNQVSAIAILLSWAELVLLIGRYPSLSTYIEMFKTTSWNFLKFLAWYSILIVAFALSFYTLFKDTEGDDNNFLNPGESIFKTIVMLTGEFDAASIPFINYPVTGHVLFVMFIFLIAIILFNLLNGLAVSDTQTIRANSRLLGYISIINLVSYIETIALGDPTWRRLFKKLKSYCCFTADSCKGVQFSQSKIFSNQVNLFPNIIPDSEITVYPNKDRKVEFISLPKNTISDSRTSLNTSCYAQCQHYHMDPEIITDAKEIIHERETKGNTMEEMFADYTLRLNAYHNKLENLEKHSKNNQKILEEILTMMKNKHSSSSDSE